MLRDNVKNIVETELSTLDKAIDYAEDHAADRGYQFHDLAIIEGLAKIHSGQQRAYREFLRVAWGKAVRIKTEKRGEIVYRLSQSAAVIPGLNIATPQSSIGRLVNIARPGAIYENSELGKYSIEDVWYFERYSGNEYLENLKNFKKMTSNGENSFSICNLLKWVKNFGKRYFVEKEADPQRMEFTSPVDEVVFESSEVGEEPTSFVEKAVDSIGIEFTSSWDEVAFESSEIEEEPTGFSESPDDQTGISLPTAFYVNLSSHQYEAAHSGESGLVFVFGVAGSGKTSVALSRSKSLAQRGQLPKDDSLYTPDFPEETQIGIVRTGELIAYLKEACNSLSLHGLPIVEYREIHEELKSYWDIDQSRNNNRRPKYYLAQKNDNEDLETRAKWFYFISKSMLETFGQQVLGLESNIPKKRVSNIDGDIFEKINEILVSHIARSLRNTDPLGFLSRVDESIKKVFDELFSQTVWVGIPTRDNNIVWLNDKHHDIAGYLLNERRVLCLVENAHNVKIIIPSEQQHNWKEWLPDEVVLPSQAGNAMPEKLKFSLPEGRTISADIIVASDADLVRYAKNGRLRFFSKIGEKTSRIRTNQLWLAHMPRIIESNDYQVGAEENTRKWRNSVRRLALENVKKHIKLIPVDLLSRTIHYLSDKYNGEFSSLIRMKQQQLISKKLSENDIDLLAAFMAAITRGMGKNSTSMWGGNIKPAPYRSSVFIDEVQDFSEIQILLLSLLSDPKYSSVTAVGDPAQCLFGMAPDMAVSFPKQMWENAIKQELTDNIRQQYLPTINALGSAFRNKFIDDIPINTGGYVRNKCVTVVHAGNKLDQQRQAYRFLSNIDRKDSVVIVVPSIDLAGETIERLRPHLRERQHRECEYSTTIDLSKRYIAHVTTPRNIKGLEFDHVIALYLDEYNLSDYSSRNSLYVIFTRPKKELYLVGDFEKVRQDFRVLIERFADIN